MYCTKFIIGIVLLLCKALYCLGQGPGSRSLLSSRVRRGSRRPQQRPPGKGAHYVQRTLHDTGLGNPSALIYPVEGVWPTDVFSSEGEYLGRMELSYAPRLQKTLGGAVHAIVASEEGAPTMIFTIPNRSSGPYNVACRRQDRRYVPRSALTTL